MTFPCLRRIVTIALLALSLALLAAPRPAHAATWFPYSPGGIPASLSFSEPPAGGGSDTALIDELARMIRVTGPGDWVLMTIHAGTHPNVLNEIAAARTRIGNIFAVAPLSAKNSSLDAAFGPNIRYCSPGCISTHTSGTMHSKFAIFTGTNDPGGTRRSNVSWVSSSNLTYSGGVWDFNDAITMYGDTAIYNKLKEIWLHMWNQSVRTINYYQPPQGYGEGPAGQLFEAPDQDGDILASLLAFQPARSDCVIRIANQEFAGRGAVVTQLRRLKSGGCFIRIVVSKISRAMCTDLRNGAVSDLRQLSDRVHSKLLLLDGGGGTNYRVFTGSQNLTTSANYQNDDLLFLTPNYKPFFDKYLEHFGVLYGRSTTNVVATDGGAC